MKQNGYEDNRPQSSKALTLASFVGLAIQVLLSAGLLVYLMILDVLPIAYLCGIALLLVAIPAAQFFLLHKARTVVSGKKIFNIVLSILITVFISVGLWYLGGFMSAFDAISNFKTEYDIYSLRVLTSSNLNSINDIKGKTIGVSALTDEADSKQCIENIKKAIVSTPKTKSYDDDDSLAKALLEGDIDVILFDEALLNMVEENRQGFSKKTKIIHEIKIEHKKAESSTNRENIDITKDSFNIYITGMDSSGKIAARGNSDVNILATVNPKTKKILLTSTPRDYYVPLEGNKNKYDKLTHAGNYGVECSMETISKLYNTPIDFYVKLNFTSVKDLVDALGGITVESDVSFSSTYTADGSMASFTKGKNRLNGNQALAFCRERKALAEGDRGRGKHQQEVINGIIDKLSSPAILTNYNKVLNAIKENTVTDFGTDEITSLIKEQLKNPSSWKTESFSVNGKGDSKLTYSYKKSKVYVMIPDQSTVEEAKAKIAEYMKE
ncbi:MAG: LCP family protein [Lachnospiraceae bacterium]|nr:LCP family protein [Lachnospiraceae bacterium]